MFSLSFHTETTDRGAGQAGSRANPTWSWSSGGGGRRGAGGSNGLPQRRAKVGTTTARVMQGKAIRRGGSGTRQRPGGDARSRLEGRRWPGCREVKWCRRNGSSRRGNASRRIRHGADVQRRDKGRGGAFRPEAGHLDRP
uniref:Predicted protein n=1 Tax=Hordeum vulgare subsp. vulgare TaxID=112509 RepID=F2D3F4_HORVV|nr:predicted protein [Hordeum vulgare subsp. vulgare]